MMNFLTNEDIEPEDVKIEHQSNKQITNMQIGRYKTKTKVTQNGPGSYLKNNTKKSLQSVNKMNSKGDTHMANANSVSNSNNAYKMSTNSKGVKGRPTNQNQQLL